jgi:hypothetical protein
LLKQELLVVALVHETIVLTLREVELARVLLVTIVGLLVDLVLAAAMVVAMAGLAQYF